MADAVVVVMTLEELEDSLPNGLHDSELRSITIDHLGHTATLQLSVFVGELDASPERREAYREGSLTISGVQFVVIEPPDARYEFASAQRLRIDACDMRRNLDPALIAALPQNAFLRSLFVDEWNAFVHIAGTEAELVWAGQEIVHSGQREHHLPGETVD